jgi:isopentenyl diphosphate isomerase/L-lactate dehydrogenase-like FMN-dependent dehydrogenase
MDALSAEARAYVAGSAGGEDTASRNREAFRRWRIVPRMLRDVAERDLSVELLGQRLPVPVLLAPIGVQSIVHEDGELASARAASDLGVPFVSSSAASAMMEEVAAELGDATGWFQFYPSADPDVTASFLRRAEDAGYEAVVVTLDTPTMGWRERDVQNAYLPFLDGEGVANYLSDPAFRDGLDAPPEEDERAALWQFVEQFGDLSMDWETVESVAERTDLPVVLKGILHPEDARESVASNAISVSPSDSASASSGSPVAMPGGRRAADKSGPFSRARTPRPGGRRGPTRRSRGGRRSRSRPPGGRNWRTRRPSSSRRLASVHRWFGRGGSRRRGSRAEPRLLPPESPCERFYRPDRGTARSG